jgi:hypothetical protein
MKSQATVDPREGGKGGKDELATRTRTEHSPLIFDTTKYEQ